MVSRYVPDQGDIVWLEFDPQAGHEQAGHRPALVLSPKSYNGKTSLMVCCPLTTKLKSNPFEVVTNLDGVSCAVLTDHVKSLDWRARKAKRKGELSDEAMLEVKSRLKALLGIV
jgi:mRNA interferase MazF